MLPHLLNGTCNQSYTLSMNHSLDYPSVASRGNSEGLQLLATDVLLGNHSLLDAMRHRCAFLRT